MERTIDTPQPATQETRTTDAHHANAHLTHTLDTGLTCLVIFGVALFAHITFEMLKGEPKPDGHEHGHGHEGENAPGKKALREQTHEACMNDTVRRYHELQLEELEHYRLTHTEQGIALLIFLGETNRQIADRIHVSESTVKKHVQKILAKTGVSNRKGLWQLIQSRIAKKAN